MATPASDSFAQLELLFTDPIQHDYEAIRPIVLFAETVSARSQALDLDRTTVGDKARRFLQHGMLGLADQRPTQSGRKAHRFPQPVERYILYLKQLYPPIHHREIVRIFERKFGYHTNHHTGSRDGTEYLPKNVTCHVSRSKTITLTDTGFRKADAPPSNIKLCQRGTWNERMCIETFNSLATVLFHAKKIRQRVARHTEARLAYLVTLLIKHNSMKITS